MNWLWFAVSLTFSFCVILGLKKNAFKLRFALIWGGLSLAVIFASAFPNYLTTISLNLGIKLASNLVFAVAIFTLGIINLILTIENNSMQRKIYDLASDAALLEYRIRKIEVDDSQNGK